MSIFVIKITLTGGTFSKLNVARDSCAQCDQMTGKNWPYLITLFVHCE